MNNLCSNTAALKRYDSEQDEADRRGEELTHRIMEVTLKATELAYEEVQLETDLFKAIIQGEELREGDYSDINVLLNKIDIAKDEARLLAQMELGRYMHRKWMDALIAAKWEQAERDVARGLV